jgi:hypothetical protein
MMRHEYNLLLRQLSFRNIVDNQDEVCWVTLRVADNEQVAVEE